MGELSPHSMSHECWVECIMEWGHCKNEIQTLFEINLGTIPKNKLEPTSTYTSIQNLTIFVNLLDQ
jgi:hypothetical protein